MDDYRSSLRVVGISLIVIGVLDIGWMAWCIAHNQGYSSSFNIFAIIAGILLVRGGLRTANIVAFFSAFILSTSVGMLLVSPFLMPFDLMFAYLRVHPVSFSVSLIIGFGVIVLLAWIYRRLTAPVVATVIAAQYPRYTSFWRAAAYRILRRRRVSRHSGHDSWLYDARCDRRACDFHRQAKNRRRVQIPRHFLEYAYVRWSVALRGGSNSVQSKGD